MRRGFSGAALKKTMMTYTLPHNPYRDDNSMIRGKKNDRILPTESLLQSAHTAMDVAG
jgi:hypothetical protein